MKLFYTICILLGFSSSVYCQTLNITPTTSPITLNNANNLFYEDIAYGNDGINTNFDIFLPDATEPSSLLIIIHGGGFINGDKADVYSNSFYETLINNLLDQNIAVATINYYLVVENDSYGIKRSLNDCKRALQFMRYYSSSLNIDETKVAVYGTSAGAAAALWLGFNDEMADAGNADPILQKSTRLQGLVCGSPQSNYDCLEWHNNVFSEYIEDGFSYTTVTNILSEERIFNYFGVSNNSELQSSEIDAYRNDVNMLLMMSSDDPEFYATSSVAYSFPTNSSELYHHPLHVKALKDQADLLGIPGVYYIPNMGIDTRYGESTQDFIIRKIGASSGTTVEIPDDAFEAYLESEFADNIEADGSTSDGFITFTNINLVLDIDFVTPNNAAPTSIVTDLTGVEQFPELKYLVVRNNNITGAVDLSGLTKLQKVYADGNPNLTSFDFTGCSSLQQVKASGCALSTLDLSTTTLSTTDVTSLTDLDVDTNNLTSLDFSGHTGIDYLDCATNNNLTQLDISSLTLLTLLRFQKCNIIGDIDVSANTNLVTLGTYDNDNLTSIDLGSIPYTNFNYFKTSSSNNLTCIYTDNPSDFQQGGSLETAIGSGYSVDDHTNFVTNASACATLSVEAFSKQSFSVYPNPSSGKFNIRVKLNSNYQILNVYGQVLKTGQLKIGDNKVDISSYNSGLYFVTVEMFENNVITKKILKQ